MKWTCLYPLLLIFVVFMSVAIVGLFGYYMVHFQTAQIAEAVVALQNAYHVV
jgi:flagellar basal body-associated protein FliL